MSIPLVVVVRIVENIGFFRDNRSNEILDHLMIELFQFKSGLALQDYRHYSKIDHCLTKTLHIMELGS